MAGSTLAKRPPGWSQAELGDKIGTGSQRVSRYETGKITPPPDVIVRSAQALNIAIDHLLIDDIPPSPLHAAEHHLGDRLAALAELPTTSPHPLHMLGALVAKNRLKTLAGSIS